MGPIAGVVEFVHQHSWPRKHTFSFSTNGTLFSAKIKEWLDRHACVGFSFSIDGTRAAHDLNRSGSYARVIKHVPWALERCRRLKIEPRVKMTIGPDTVSTLAAGIAELHDMGFEKVDANVPYENIWATVWNTLSLRLPNSWKRCWSFTWRILDSSDPIWSIFLSKR